MIHVREQKDAIWYSGSLNDKIGWFPRNYVRPATELEINTNQNPTATSTTTTTTSDTVHEIYEAIYPYEGTDGSDLSFDIGEHIIVLKRDGDWWTGQIGDRVGAFPYNYVQKLEHIPPTAIAIQAYQSTEEGHLSFDKDQIIHIINHDNEKGLYQGEIQVRSIRKKISSFYLDFLILNSFLIKQYMLAGFRLIVYKCKQQIHPNLRNHIHLVNIIKSF